MPQDDSTESVSIRGMNRDLYRWLKSQAALEAKTIGEKLNDSLADAKSRSDS